MFASSRNLVRYTTNLLANESPTDPYIYLLSDAKPIRFTPTFFDPINYKLALQRIPVIRLTRLPNARMIGQRALIGITRRFYGSDFSLDQ